MGVRMTSGTDASPPYIQRYLLAWLRIWSVASARKSPNISSATGLRPRRAAPVLQATMPASLSGVVSTRSGKRVERPLVALKAPPYGSRMSSPRTKASGSSSSRAWSPELIDST